VLHVAADIKAAADDALEVRREQDHFVQEWLESVGEGMPGYVTPKVAVGAIVGNDAGEVLLVQRADSGIWLYPTGWADVGYSPAEVAVKEVLEETGIECEPVQLLSVIDGQRMGFTRFGMYMLAVPLPGHGGHAGRAPARDLRCRLVRATSSRPPPRAPRGGARWRSPRSTACRCRPASNRCASRSGAATRTDRRTSGVSPRAGRAGSARPRPSARRCRPRTGRSGSSDVARPVVVAQFAADGVVVSSSSSSSSSSDVEGLEPGDVADEIVVVVHERVTRCS
jgi:ADP-ribose pyrophosphatase YjhB (NUDIX family)